MPVTKHDIEWLINVIAEYERILPLPLLQSARKLITESNYRKSVCVIHPVNEKAYDSLRKEIAKYSNPTSGSRYHMGQSGKGNELLELVNMMKQYPETGYAPIPLYEIARRLIEMGPETGDWEKSLRSVIRSRGYYFEREHNFPEIPSNFWTCYCLARYGLSADIVVPELLNQAAWTVDWLIETRCNEQGGFMTAVAGTRLLCTYLNHIKEIPLPIESRFKKAIGHSCCYHVVPYLALILAKTGVRDARIVCSLLQYKATRTQWDADHLNTAFDGNYSGFSEDDIFYSQCRPVLEHLYPEHESYVTFLLSLYDQVDDACKRSILVELGTCHDSHEALGFILGSVFDPDRKLRIAACLALRRFACRETEGQFGWEPRGELDPRIQEALERLKSDKYTEVGLYSHYCMFWLGLTDRQSLTQILNECGGSTAESMANVLAGKNPEDHEHLLMLHIVD